MFHMNLPSSDDENLFNIHGFHYVTVLWFLLFMLPSWHHYLLFFVDLYCLWRLSSLCILSINGSRNIWKSCIHITTAIRLEVLDAYLHTWVPIYRSIHWRVELCSIWQNRISLTLKPGLYYIKDGYVQAGGEFQFDGFALKSSADWPRQESKIKD